MFTGIVQSVCKVVSASRSGGGMKLCVDLQTLAADVKLGDSIAVNGLCLTASKVSGKIIEFDVSQESVSRSTISKLNTSDSVNIELALKADGRFGGHIVQGHIDGTAKVKSIQNKDSFRDITFSADSALLDEMVIKGSVAVSGVSLTISAMDSNSFTVSTIPVTLKDTTLGQIKTGDEVNIETDIIGKMVKKQISKMLPSGTGLTAEKLRQMGF
jgi:riboflavin synthase